MYNSLRDKDVERPVHVTDLREPMLAAARSRLTALQCEQRVKIGLPVLDLAHVLHYVSMLIIVIVILQHKKII